MLLLWNDCKCGYVVVNGYFVLEEIYKLFFEYIIWVEVSGGLNSKVICVMRRKFQELLYFVFIQEQLNRFFGFLKLDYNRICWKGWV